MKVVVVDATDELTIDYDDLERKLSDRTRVVAFALASNATGSVADAQRICRLAREAGALSWIDAVHYAAHEPVDVAEIGCDVLLCSPYKFCGPHLGMAYLRSAAAQDWRAYKARPSASNPLGRRFETGTQPYELLAGLPRDDRLPRLARRHERAARLRTRSSASTSSRRFPETVTLYGPPTMEGRVPTFLLNVDGVERRARRARAGRARDRRLVRRQLVLRLAG